MSNQPSTGTATFPTVPNKGQYIYGMTKVDWAMGNWAQPCTDSKVTGPGQDRAGKNRRREAQGWVAVAGCIPFTGIQRK